MDIDVPMKMIECSTCNGSGVIDDINCPKCLGKKRIEIIDWNNVDPEIVDNVKEHVEEYMAAIEADRIERAFHDNPYAYSIYG